MSLTYLCDTTPWKTRELVRRFEVRGGSTPTTVDPRRSQAYLHSPSAETRSQHLLDAVDFWGPRAELDSQA